MPQEPQSSEMGADIDVQRIEHLIACVAHRVQMLREKIENRYLQDGRSTSTGALAEIVSRLLSRLYGELRLLYQEVEIHPLDDTLSLLQDINYVITRMVPGLVEAMDQADQDTTSIPVIEAYADLADRVRYGTQTIIYPAPGYNASFDEIMRELRYWAKLLVQEGSQTVFNGAPPWFITITYPMAERDMTLCLAHLAHEMGHFIDMELGITRALHDDPPVFEEEDWLLTQRSAESETYQIDSRTLGQDVESLADQFTAQWLPEVTADFLGVCVLGPACLLAFDEITLTPSIPDTEELRKSHPPVQLRRMLMAKLVKEEFLAPIRADARYGDLSPQQKGVLATVCSWTEELSVARPIRVSTFEHSPRVGSEVAQAVYHALEAAVLRAADRLRREQMPRLVEKPWFCGTTDLIDALELQSLISIGLIPTVILSDWERAPSFAAVMNSGWFHLLSAGKEFQYFSREEQESPRGSTMESWINLQDLIAKGLESLHFKREYMRRKGVSR